VAFTQKHTGETVFTEKLSGNEQLALK